MVIHVALDLHGEELRREEEAHLSVPAWEAVLHGVGLKGTDRMLVHADRDADVVEAELNGLSSHADGAGGRGTSVVDVGERDACEPELVHDGVGIVHLVAPAERELDVAPLQARIAQGGPGCLRRHVDR